MALAVAITLRLGAKLTRILETRKGNMTGGYTNEGQTLRPTGAEYSWYDGNSHDGDDYGPPGYPFFFWYYKEVGNTAVFTAQKAIEQELERFSNLLVNSPSIVSKEDQTENGIVLSSGADESTKTQVNELCTFS